MLIKHSFTHVSLCSYVFTIFRLLSCATSEQSDNDLNNFVRKSKRPNILVLLADDLGYGDIGPFGNQTISTPNLDQLARDGFILTHHLTAASLCTPSRAGLLTGRYPIRYGMTSDWLTRVYMFAASSGGLPNQEVTFARLLKQHGYATALIGKWHLGSQCPSPPDNCALPTGHGFDLFYGLPLTNLKDFGKDGSSVFLSFFPHYRLVLITICVSCLLTLFLLHRNSFRQHSSQHQFRLYRLSRQSSDLSNEVNSVELVARPNATDLLEDDNQQALTANCNRETFLTSNTKVFKNKFRSHSIQRDILFDCSLLRLVISLTLAIIFGSSLFALVFQLNLTRLNSILMRNLEVIEQPIQMESLTARLLQNSINFMRSSVQGQQPFMLMLAFSKVHTAHFPSDKFVGKSQHGAYGDCVMELDWTVGQVLNELQRLQQQDNTLVYFTSDNGAHLEELDAYGRLQGGYNGHLPGGKGQGAMEGGIRVPAIIRFPMLHINQSNDREIVSQGRNVTTATSQLDWMATVLDILDEQNFKPKLDGRSLLPLLRKTLAKQDKSVTPMTEKAVIERSRFFFHYCGSYLHAVRYAQDDRHVYKLFYYKPRFRSSTDLRCKFVCRCYGQHVQRVDPVELYDVAQDPQERRQLNQGSNNSQQIDQILSLIQQQVLQHEQSLREQSNRPSSQLTLWHTIWKPHLQPCCNFPFCSCAESSV